MTGFRWGAARHFNYFGEIIQAVALALPAWLVTGSLLPWLYPFYYIGLLGARQVEVTIIHCAACTVFFLACNFTIISFRQFWQNLRIVLLCSKRADHVSI
jgi:hypothetical protein